MAFISKSKEITNFVRSLLESGDWKVEDGGKHIHHLTHKNGWRCPIPTTPSDNRAYLNFKTRTMRALRMDAAGMKIPCRLA